MSQEKYLKTSTGSGHQYSALDRKDTEIRLLRIHPYGSDPHAKISCALFNVYLDRPPPYTALSYTWGLASDPQYPIQLDSHAFKVRENLKHALEHLRLEKEEVVIWIDALCINQADIPERNHQVSNMRAIYEQANEVIVWLGLTQDESSFGIRFAQDIFDHEDDEEWIVRRLLQPDGPQCLKSLAKLFTRPYWDRIWIIQEIVLAKHFIVTCGNDSTEGNALSEAQRLICSVKDENETPIFIKLLSNDFPAQQRIMWRGPASLRQTREGVLSKSLSLYELLQHHTSNRATDPRDMIYGLAGLTSLLDDSTFKIDYLQSMSEVYTDFVRHEITRSKRLDIITRIRPGQSNASDLPSWVPNWSLSTPTHLFLQDFRQPQFLYSATGSSQAEVKFLKTGVLSFNGIYLGQVNHVGDPSTMQNYLDIDQAIMTFDRWRKRVLDMPNSLEAQLAFCRTMRAHRLDAADHPELGQDVTTTEFLKGLLGYWGERLITLTPETVLDQTMIDFIAFKTRTFPEPVVAEDFWAANIQNGFAPFMWDRCFFMSPSGLMGLGPSDMSVGDVICIPLGCSSPVILRPVGNKHVLLGEAYADSLVDGEALGLLKLGTLHSRTFVVY